MSVSLTAPQAIPHCSQPLALAACALLLLPTVVAAEGDAEGIARRSNSIARTTMSPFCPGRTLADCPSPNAQAWRNEIRSWVEAGVAPAEIKARLQARRPDADLSGGARNPLSGYIPVAALLLSLLALSLGIWRVRRRRPQSPPQADSEAAPAQLDTRLAEELDALS